MLPPATHTEVLERRPSEVVRVREFRLRVLGGPEAGRSHQSGGARTVIGTHESADLVLADRSLSRFHCEIRMAAGQAVVRDLGSKNGTRVDDTLVLAAPLAEGAVLTLGRTRLGFELGKERPRELPPGVAFGLMRGRSPAMRAAFAVLESAAGADVTLLLDGETGSGKDLAAESLHRRSARRQGPFVVVDCGAIPANLLEAELFGHERGAFTGADRARTGAFQAASGGTLYLDEVGELGLDLQPKLLRVLERKEVQRIGSSRRVPVDVRVVAATNRDLRVEVNARRFRADLFYRLAVLELTLPPLRERPEDLPELVDALLDSLGVTGSRAAAMRSSDFIAELASHAWPGNVRELRNYLERCALMGGRVPLIDRRSSEGPALLPGETLKQTRTRWLAQLERRYLQAVLEQTGHNVSAAARAAGIGRAYFYQLLDRHRLKRR